MKATCPACGGPLGRSGDSCLVLLPSGMVAREKVCGACYHRATRIVAVAPEFATRSSLLPFARHLRRLSAIYKRLGQDGREAGLDQAAGLLEIGKVPAEDEIQIVDVSAMIDQPRLRALPQPAAKRVTPLLDPPPSRANGHAAPEASGELGPCARAILAVLVQHGNPLSRRRIAVTAGYSETSGGFGSALARLRAEDLVYDHADHTMTVSPNGMRAAGPVDALPKGAALLEYWSEKVGPCAAAILQTLAAAYPAEVDRDRIAERTGYSGTSGGFGSALAELRALALVDGHRASDELMEAVQR